MRKMIINTKLNYESQKLNLKPEFKAEIIPVEDISWDEKTRNFCKSCSNYKNNWSCPPFSPTFSEIVDKFESSKILVYFYRIQQNQMPDDLHPGQKSIILDNIFSPKLHDLGLEMEEKISGRALIAASCRKCKPCARKNGESCKKPEKRRYSLESTGIKVYEIVKEYLNFNLEWYLPEKSEEIPKFASENKTKNPDYLAWGGGLLTKQPAETSKFKKILKNTSQNILLPKNER